MLIMISRRGNVRYNGERKINNMGDNMNNKMTESSGPKIIAIEGIDGSGKTLQTEMLYHKLEQLGYKVALRSYPVYRSFFGQQVGELLAGKDKVDANNVDPKSMCLWYALDRWNDFKKFDYTAYDYVLLNRFTLSSAVYQSMRCPEKDREQMINWVFELEHTQLGLPIPNLYVVFDLNPELSAKNGMKKGEREYIAGTLDVYESSREYLKNVREQYVKLAQKSTNIGMINCMNRDNEMDDAQKILGKVLATLKMWKL